MVVYVTGAAGFLGSHLVDHLIGAGQTVVGIDNLATGRRANLSAVERSECFTFVTADAAQPWEPWIASLGAALRRPRLILHFASPASPQDYGRDPLGTLAVNALGTMHACALSHSCGARLVLASTSECYGDPLEHPQTETYWGNVNPVGLRACYDEAKRYAEAYLTSAVRVHGIDGRIARIFNTYGPRMRPGDGRVIPAFCAGALRGDPLPVQGDGEQTRSFCYIDDLIDGIARLADRDGLAGTVINLGNPVEIRIRELAQLVSDVAGVALRTAERPLPPDDPLRRCPDITRARRLLGWEPHTTLHDGVAATLAFFRAASL